MTFEVTGDGHDVAVLGGDDDPTIEGHVHPNGQAGGFDGKLKRRLLYNRRGGIVRVGITVGGDEPRLVGDIVSVVDVKDGVDA